MFIKRKLLIHAWVGENKLHKVKTKHSSYNTPMKCVFISFHIMTVLNCYFIPLNASIAMNLQRNETLKVSTNKNQNACLITRKKEETIY